MKPPSTEKLEKASGLSWQRIRYFAAVVRSDTVVRKAFEGQACLAWWWRLVLALHGRPAPTSFPSAFRCRSVADGFRFYGWLYRGLAILLGVSAICCCLSDVASCFWVLWMTVCAAYLWIVSGLAFAGASQFEQTAGEAVWHLVAFLFFVSLFLAGCLISISIQVRLTGGLPDMVNVGVTLGVMAFGVGSYLIELAALVAREPLQKARLI